MNIFRSFSTALLLLSSPVCSSAANRLTLPNGEWVEYDRTLVAELVDPLADWQKVPSYRTGWVARDPRFSVTWPPPPSLLREEFEALSDTEKKLVAKPPRSTSQESYSSTTDRVVLWRCSAGFTYGESEKYHFAWVDRDGWEGDLDFNTIPTINYERRASPGVMPRHSPKVTLRAWLASEFKSKRSASKTVAELTMVNPCFIASPLWPESKHVEVVKVRDTEIKLERLVRHKSLSVSKGVTTPGTQLSLSVTGALEGSDLDILHYSFADNLGNYIVPTSHGGLFEYATQTRALWHDARNWRVRLFVCPTNITKMRAHELHTFTRLSVPRVSEVQHYTGQAGVINHAIIEPLRMETSTSEDIQETPDAEVRFVTMLFKLADMRPEIEMSGTIYWQDDQGRKESQVKAERAYSMTSQDNVPMAKRSFGIYSDAKWLDVTVAVPTIDMLEFYTSPEFLE